MVSFPKVIRRGTTELNCRGTMVLIKVDRSRFEGNYGVQKSIWKREREKAFGSQVQKVLRAKSRGVARQDGRYTTMPRQEAYHGYV